MGTLKTIVTATLTLIVFGAVSALVFRSRPLRLIRAIRASNKHFLNPVMLRFAGKKGFYAAAVHHVGRKSGRRYVTPVVAERIHDGVLIPLPYGTNVDWLRNVLTTGSAELVAQGVTMGVCHPVVIPAAEARRHLPAWIWRRSQYFGVDEYLRLVVADQDALIAARSSRLGARDRHRVSPLPDPEGSGFSEGDTS